MVFAAMMITGFGFLNGWVIYGTAVRRTPIGQLGSSPADANGPRGLADRVIAV
jgi:hypothetical protein